MGCYGIGINRIIASAIEARHDRFGIIFPVSIAPFEVIITSVNAKDEEVTKISEKIYQKLKGNGVDVLLDDRAVRAGVKFKDADLIGIPLRVTVGKKALADGNVEIKLRSEQQSQEISIETAADKVIEMIEQLYADLEK